MAILVNAHTLSKAFSAHPLFEALTFSIESGERIGLIGPNGAGKSTLLRILCGKASQDGGTLSFQRGLRVGYLEQVPELDPDQAVFDAVLEGAGGAGADWSEQALAQEIMARLSLPMEARVATLSGGWRKRVALARELVKRPDLLLLDEPTNHLDVESILWLEEFIAKGRFATLTVTHDRLFLQRVSNRILELDRRNPGGLLSVAGDYAHYLEVKESVLASQASQEERLRNTLRRETEWLRQGAKARTTKQQARIGRAEELKQTVEELSYRNADARVRLQFQGAEKNPKKLIEAQKISKTFLEHASGVGKKILVIPEIDLQITAGSRIGLLGPNGCGKSTLIRLLLGEEVPDTGSVLRSDLLKVAYFEQNRETLDPALSILKTVCPRGETVEFQGRKIHVKSYLDRFLFTYGQMEMAVGKLSGGEQSRVLLAKLMMTEANLLVLDEPTNDLDLATLNVLEEMLGEFPGAVLLVTHDRYFLDQVANRILAFGLDERGQKQILPFHGLAQWEVWHEGQKRIIEALSKGAGGASPSSTVSAGPGSGALVTRKRKLGFNEQRELDGMESRIQSAEQKLGELEAESLRPQTVSNSSRLVEITQGMSRLQVEIERLYARWAELE